MNEDEALSRYGFDASESELAEIRSLLRTEIKRERESQGGGDTELMKLFCVHLFTKGSLDDALLIWDAKTASMDADASIDVQLLCGRGLAETKEYLEGEHSKEAAAAAERIAACEAAGDFDGFSPAELAAEYIDYYREEPE